MDEVEMYEKEQRDSFKGIFIDTENTIEKEQPKKQLNAITSFIPQLFLEKYLLRNVAEGDVLNLINSAVAHVEQMQNPATAVLSARAKTKLKKFAWFFLADITTSEEEFKAYKAKVVGNPKKMAKVKLGKFSGGEGSSGEGDLRVDPVGGEEENQDSAVILIGEHMSLLKRVYQGKEPITLGDGTVINPGDLVGELHIVRNLPKLQPGDSLIKFTRQKLREAEKSLKEIGRLCHEEDERFENIKAVYGVSHLAASIAKRLGFQVQDIDRLPRIYRWLINRGFYNIAKSVAGENTEWLEIAKNFNPAGIAVISKDAIVLQYMKSS